MVAAKSVVIDTGTSGASVNQRDVTMSIKQYIRHDTRQWRLSGMTPHITMDEDYQT
jgi:hypothetical protein